MDKRKDTIDFFVEQLGQSEEDIAQALSDENLTIKDDGEVYIKDLNKQKLISTDDGEGLILDDSDKGDGLSDKDAVLRGLKEYFVLKSVSDDSDSEVMDHSEGLNDDWFINNGEEEPIQENSVLEVKSEALVDTKQLPSDVSGKGEKDTVYEAAVVEKDETTVLPVVPPSLPEKKDKEIEQKSQVLTGVPEDVINLGGSEKMEESKDKSGNGKMKYGIVGLLVGAAIGIVGTCAYVQNYGEKTIVPVEGNPAYVQMEKDNKYLTKVNRDLKGTNAGLESRLKMAGNANEETKNSLLKTSAKLALCQSENKIYQAENKTCQTAYATCEDDNSANIGSILTCFGEVDYLWQELGDCANGLADCEARDGFKKDALKDCHQAYRKCDRNLADAKSNNDHNADYKKQFETASDDLASCESKLRIARETTCPTKKCPAAEIVEKEVIKEVYIEKECKPQDCVKMGCAFLRD